MKSRVLFALTALASLISIHAAAAPPETWGDLEPGGFRVGFRLIVQLDHSRAVRADSTASESWSRPIRVYVWYPASPEAKVESMTFGRYLDLADEDVWPDQILGSARGRLATSRRPLARSLDAGRLEGIRAQLVGAVEGVSADIGSFPVIVVAQGLYYESPISHAAFCEYLASHGFVVATAPLVGTNSPMVQLNVVDLETQVRDLEFVIARVRRLPFVNPGRLGIFGFDMGGMSALVLAMRNPEVDALATTDSAILFGHPAGIPVDAPHYDPSMLHCPWLHVTQRQFGVRPDEHEGPDLFAEAKYADRYLLATDGMGHWDFTSYALIEDRDPVMGYWPPSRGGEKERYEVVCRYIRTFFSVHLAGREGDEGLLEREPEEVAPGLGFSLEHRTPAPALPTYPDFLNALVGGEVEEAEAMAKSLRDTDPDGPLSQEGILNRLGYHLMAAWQLFEAGILVFELNRDLHPESVNVYDSLGEAHIWKGDDETAMRWFRRVLELDPENERATRIIERLEERSRERGEAP